MQSFNIVNFGVNLLTATVSQNFEEEEKFTIHTIYQKYQMISLLFLFIHKCNCPAISMTIDDLGLFFIYNCHLKLLLYCKNKAGQGEICSCELLQFFTKTFFFLFLSSLYLGKIQKGRSRLLQFFTKTSFFLWLLALQSTHSTRCDIRLTQHYFFWLSLLILAESIRAGSAAVDCCSFSPDEPFNFSIMHCLTPQQRSNIYSIPWWSW